MLKEFARYLKTLDPQAIAAEQITIARRLDLPILRLFKDLPEPQLLAMAREGVEKLLDDFETGHALDTVRESLAQWERGDMPGLRREELGLEDLVLTYLAQKQTLLHFLPGFSREPETILAVVVELGEYVARAQLIAIGMLMRKRERDAEQVARLEATQRATQAHLEESQAANEELQTQQAELEQLTDELHLNKRQLEGELARNKAIMEAAFEGVILMSPAGDIVDWNPAAEKIFGRPAAEVVGQELASVIVPPAYRERHRAGLQRYSQLHEGPMIRKMVEVPALHADGHEFPAEVYIVPLGHDGARLFAGFIRDISERKRWERQLSAALSQSQESRARMAFLAEAGLVLGSSLDYEATLAKVAQLAVPKIADWATVQMLQDGALKTLAVAHVNPEKVAWALELQKRFPPNPDDPNGPLAILRSGQPQLISEIPKELVEALPPDQREVLDALGLVSSMSVPILVRGQAIGLIMLVSAESGIHYDQGDLTFAQDLARRAAAAIENARLYHEAQQAESELRELNTSLEKRVAERTGLLEATNKELEAFSYSVSHDLRAPLRAIDGFSQALEEDYADKVDEAGKDYLHRIRAASQRMAQLIEDLLQFSRLTRGELTRTQVDLADLARDVASGLTQAQPDRKVDWVFPEHLLVQGDPRLLRVVLDNLLSNAFKFTSHHPSARIELATGEKDGRTIYCVKDNGAGFDMAYAQKLFTPFQRLHTTSEFPGTGIGLATTQRVVHRHGGRIWAEAAPEQGARFCFTLGTGGGDDE
ncbi:MAG TPA: PAS domain S-box protein [Oscillatoriaceae cyanobacterium]